MKISLFMQKVITSTAALAMLFMTACGEQSEKQQGPQYSAAPGNGARVYFLAIHPLHNPGKLVRSYKPIAEYLDKNIAGAHFEIEASRDYQAYEEKLRQRHAAFILPNPWQTLEAMKVGYSVIAQAGNPEDFRGIFIARKDSKIHQPTDVKGKVVSYPSSTALAACIMPQNYLHHNGVSITKDIVNKFVGSQESSIMHVYLGESDLGATWPPPWRAFQKDFPEEASKLHVIWETDSLLNNSVMVRDDVPPEIVAKVSELLSSLHEHDEGRKLLAGIETERFIRSSNDDYAVVRTFIEEFEKTVRPVESHD